MQEHVRRHLTASLDLTRLAEVAGASRFHFSRIYKAHTGETLNHFVRRARLERAATLMRARPELKLLDVAVAVGLDSAANFSRVFRQHYAVAPSQWNRRSSLQPQLEGYEDHLASARAQCPSFQAIIREHPARRIAYVRVNTPFLDRDKLEAGYGLLQRSFERQGVDWRSQTLIGMSWDQPETTPLERVQFDLGFPTPAAFRLDRSVGERLLPSMRCVHVHVRGPLPHIALAWEFLYENYLPNTKEEPADLPSFKYFHRQPCESGWADFDLDCCIALR